jgi:hypothetical protein
MAIFPGSAITPAGGGYTIDQSLRFNDDDSAYLSRTPASAGNRKTWTWSGWVKLGNIPSNDTLFSAKTNTAQIWLAGTTGQLRIEQYNGAGGYNFRYDYEGFIRDPSAWYHLVVAFDTANATEANRIKVYVNGIQRQISYTYNSMSQNFESEFNNSETHWLGTLGSQYFDGYMAEVHFIDGQALTPDYFGETDEDYGHWKPIRYTGSYGTNGFYLDFSNSGSIGEDQAGSNDWTANNLAATDVVLDSPTNNFATWNPLAIGEGGQTYSEGNLKLTTAATAAWHGGVSNIGMSSGKWYAEFIYTSSVVNPTIGVPMTQTPRHPGTGAYGGAEADTGIGFAEDGSIYTQGSAADKTNSGFAVGDVIGIALDVDNRTVDIYKNNVDIGGATSIDVGTYYFGAGEYNATSFIANFGQDSSFAGNKTAQNNTDDNGVGDFYYAPPSGFLALCTANLPDPAVIPGENFGATLFQASETTISGLSAKPELIWVKNRVNPYSHRIADIIRGTDAELSSNDTSVETNHTNGTDGFTADGWTHGGYGSAGTNDFVGWFWKAGGSGSSNTDGSITSTVSANPDAGFSIGTYTGNATAGATVGHGLSQAPEMIIIKDRPTVNDWPVYHASAGATAFFKLNSTVAQATSSTVWNNTAPTTSVFTLGTSNLANNSTKSHVFYAFHSVDGFSKFGSYTGNGSSDGTFVYTGFRPAFVILKSATSATSWVTYDAKRDTYNAVGQVVYANSSGAESDTRPRADFLSNGFKLRSATEPNWSGETIIYMAFAEYPFKYTNAR